MRPARYSHPEWGYLAPAPSFVHMVRIVATAVAVGACAGAATAVSLIDRSGADQSVAARTLAQPINEAMAPVPAPAPQSPVISKASDSAPVEPSSAPPTRHSANAVALAESPRISASTPTPDPAATDAVPSQVKTGKKPREAKRGAETSGAPLALLPFFRGHPASGANWPYEARGEYHDQHSEY
ncbi:MAG TPA: hypothetical protein VEJ37_12595 [Xanthobacteraceae bacterium]|nr:hypothetical protein [Xanthobacteraceae bacterium]